MAPVKYMIFGVLAGVAADAAPVQFQSSEQQAALVELYTSEGCSSCPPAELWLSRWKDKPGLWSDFVPVAFHVDYWNHLGWRDKWSSKQYSDRQRDYARAWGGDRVYTPELVLNGKEWHDWYRLRGTPAASATKTGILKVASEDNNHWQVNFQPAAAGTTAFEVNAGLLACGLASEVEAGENAGRHLQHDFVIIKLVKEPLTGNEGEFNGAFTMTAGQNLPRGNLALAVWVTRNGTLEPVQSVGGWLVPQKKDK